MDPYTYPIPFNEDTLQEFTTRKNLRIGYFSQNGYFQSSAAVVRAVETAKEALEKMGHTLVEFEVPEMDKAFGQYMKILLANGYKGIEGALDGEKPLWFYEGNQLVSNHPILKRPVFKLAKSMGFGRQIDLVENCPPLTSAEYITEYFSMIDYREMFTNKWKEMNLDAMISPVTATPAPQHRGTEFTF